MHAAYNDKKAGTLGITPARHQSDLLQERLSAQLGPGYLKELTKKPQQVNTLKLHWQA